MTSTSDLAAGAYLPPGHLLQNRYQIVEEVGRGGYSVVYHARDVTLGSAVAVKLLVPPPATAHVARERMRREVRAARGLSHPHIAAVHDFLEEGPWSFIVMELVDGEDLASRVARRGVVAPDDVARWGSQIADALATAHRRGVLHRDVKPQNILIDTACDAHLVDFGSARLDGLTTMTQTGGIVGTIAYTAPEVLAGIRADGRSDVYSLGMTLLFGLLGRLPNRMTGAAGVIESVDGQHPRGERPDVPDWLDGTIARATARRASMRFPTAHELCDALRERDDPNPAHTGEPSECLICKAIDPFNLGLCVQCAGSSSDADTFVFFKPGKSVREVLWRETGPMWGRAYTENELEEVLCGERPLVRVPRAAADHIVAELAKRSVASFALSSDRAARAIPFRFYGLLLAVIGVGVVTGLIVDPRIIVASPTVALLLWFLAVRVAQRPLIETPKHRSHLPQETEARVVGTLTSLPAGMARDLLVEFIRLADRSYRRVTGASYDQEIAQAIVDLTIGACDVAVDIADCDEQLYTRQARSSLGAELPTEWMDELTRLERIRDRFVQQFLEATAIVARIRNDELEMDPAMTNVIQDAAASIVHHVQATEEVERILS